MEYNGLIYLDNAATSYPKPPEVYGEVMKAMMQYGGNAGRGIHRLSMEAAEKIYECRCEAAKLLGVSEPERVFFTLNATHGINTVIKGLLRKGDHVIISNMEHNAVFRPIYKMAKKGLISYDVFDATLPRSEDVCANIASKMRRSTKLVICAHASNICSLTLPVEEIGRLCRACGVLFVLDGAQSAGRKPIDVDKMAIDALCVPSHKGLLGPQGSGMVLLGKGVILDTLTEGGNGVNSLLGDMPELSPERYEAGTLPLPAIAGLCEGLRFVSSVGEARIDAHEKGLFKKARDGLLHIDGVTVHMPRHEGSVISFNIDGISADAVGEELNSYGICVRSGYHCSALGHRSLGTEKEGTVRVSFGIFNNSEDVERLTEAVKIISRK